jgi:hypothetical protein
MRSCRQVVAGLVAIAFVVTALSALLVVNLVQVVTDQEVVEEAVANVDVVVVDAVSVLVAEAMEEQARQQGVPVVVDQAVLQEAVTELIPPGWVEAQTDSAVDAVFGFLETGDPEAAQVEINVRPLLTRLRGQPGQQAMLVVIQGLPECEQPIPFDLESGNLEIPGCLPPGLDTVEAATFAHALLVETLDQNPQLTQGIDVVRVPLFDAERMAPAERQQWQRWHRFFVWGQRWAWLLWLLPLACLLLILVLAVRSVAAWGQWWGWPLLVTAVSAYVLTLVVPAVFRAVVRRFVISALQASTPPLPIAPLINNLLTPLTGAWLTRIYVQAGVMLAVGLSLVVVGFVAGVADRRA